ncbi:hypothetical protein IT570_14105 [Candidatus Sumerlaeota bacterium]|nr:hypothetical protein [Candidatus Sumerlaeota bacterium]
MNNNNHPRHVHSYPVSPDPSHFFALGSILAMDEAMGFLTSRLKWRAALPQIPPLICHKGHPASALHDRIEQALGVPVPVSDDGVVDMIEEVRRFKWLEAERAGRDIWRERHPSDPEGGALREWFRLYFGAWYLARCSRRFSRA